MTRNPVENCVFMVLFLFGINQLQAQAPLPVQDSALPQPVAKRVLPIKPTTDFDQRFYYMQKRWANVWGYRVGLLVHDKYKIGIGGYYMNEGIADPNTAADLAISRTSGSQQYRQQLYLGTVYYEPYLIRRNLWESSVVFETGYGRSVNLQQDSATKIISGKQNKAFIPAGIGLSVNLKMPPLFGCRPIRWLGINAIAGYRKVLFQDGDPYNYDGIYWSISGAIFLDRVLEDLHNWKVKKEKRKY
jgi:hypothetical protein